MRITEVSVAPYEKAIFPALKFEVTLEYKKGNEAPIEITGWLKDSNGRIIAELYEETSSSRSFTIAARGSAEDKNLFGKTTCTIRLVAPLNERAVKWIDEERRKDKKGDVYLVLDLNVRKLVSAAKIFQVWKINPTNSGLQQILVPTSKGREPSKLLVTTYDEKYGRGHAAPGWIISGETNPVFLEVEEENLTYKKRIPATDWIHDFAPKLGIGEFFIIELPKIKDPGHKYIAEALEELNHAVLSMREGRFREALLCVRNAITNHNILVKKQTDKDEKPRGCLNQELVEAILSGVPEDSKNNYKEILKAVEKSLKEVLHTCLSKFIHLDTGKLLKAPLREDVEYAVFATLSAIKYLSELLKEERT